MCAHYIQLFSGGSRGGSKGFGTAVYNRWTGLVDWTSGLDWYKIKFPFIFVHVDNLLAGNRGSDLRTIVW